MYLSGSVSLLCEASFPVSSAGDLALSRPPLSAPTDYGTTFITVTWWSRVIVLSHQRVSEVSRCFSELARLQELHGWNF